MQDMKVITDFPNYSVTTDGRVYSNRYNRYLKPDIHPSGYKRIVLCNNGKRKRIFVHRLVAMVYIPNPENKSDVDHINRKR